jgi:hypothetical protein
VQVAEAIMEAFYNPIKVGKADGKGFVNFIGQSKSGVVFGLCVEIAPTSYFSKIDTAYPKYNYHLGDL